MARTASLTPPPVVSGALLADPSPSDPTSAHLFFSSPSDDGGSPLLGYPLLCALSLLWRHCLSLLTFILSYSYHVFARHVEPYLHPSDWVWHAAARGRDIPLAVGEGSGDRRVSAGAGAGVGAFSFCYLMSTGCSGLIMCLLYVHSQVEVTVVHLLPRTQYEFRVSSFSALGNSSWSASSALVTTAGGEVVTADRLPHVLGAGHGVSP